jgi:hypothetical protein
MQKRLTSLITLKKFSLIAILFLYSCSEHDIRVPHPTPPIPNPDTLPSELCHTNVIDGYTDKISYYPDEKIIAYLQANKAVDLCRLDIYSMDGRVAFSIASPLLVQQMNSSDPSVDGFGYMPTVQFNIPKDVKSGMYQIENSIPFIIKTKGEVDLAIVYPSNTVNAYCLSGGRSLYSVDNKPTAVSFLRPMGIQSFSAQCMSWFHELESVKIGYLADSDLDDFSSIENAKILVVVGHNEYWTRKARINFDAFVDGGKHALVLSGNTMWWQVRYSRDEHKQLICYKLAPDPIGDPLLKTINWDNPELQYPIISSIGADFPRGGYGLKTDNGWNGYKITSPDSPLLEGLNLKKGDIISIPTTEWDGAPISSFDSDGFPILDREAMNVDQIELIGFDIGFRVKETYGTFFVMKKTSASGVIINTSSTDWCSDSGMGSNSGNAIKQITRNAIDKLLSDQSVFSKKSI